MSEIDGRLLHLAELLLARTQADNVDWEPMSRDDSFAYTGMNGGFVISLVGSDSYRLSVRDSHGNPLDGLISNPYEDHHATVEQLYLAARRKALRADQVIDSLIGEITDIPPF